MTKHFFLSVALLASLHAQNLKTTINEVINTNPVILERLKNYNATKEDITSSQAGYYPQVNISLGAGVEKTDKRNQANSVADTHDNYTVYQNSLTYTQNLFNGFGTTYQVKGQEYKTLSAAYSYIEKVNDRSFAMTNQYIELMKNEALLENAQENIDIDQEIFQKVQKLYDSGLTTLSEVNKIESSLALAKSNYVVQENTVLNNNFQLATILGRSLDVTKMTKPTLDIVLPSTREEAAEFAIHNNPSILVSKFNIKLAQATNKEKESAYYPKIDISISQSMNKNLSAIKGNRDAFKAMVFLSYNIFNGFSDDASLQKSISSIHQEVESKNNIQRQIIEGLSLAYIANTKLEEQLVHLKEYRKYSKKTLTLYQKEYDLGRRSLLDVLSAQNDFIRSKAQIITTQYSILFAKYRILDAMGILVDTLLGDKNSAYGNVNLVATSTPIKKDTLPIMYDRDQDLITDDMDLCNNSLSTQMKDNYGCFLKDDKITQIERYNGFLFLGDKFLSSKKLDDLMSQLKPYGLQRINFTLLGNAQDANLQTEALKKLSQTRAQTIKTILLKAGVPLENIVTIANADNAPLFSNSNDKNNRVDIVVKKLK